MGHFVREGRLETKVHSGIYDVTEFVKSAVIESGLSEGQVVIQSMHATTGVYINEPEPRLHDDMLMHLADRCQSFSTSFFYLDIQ